MYITNYLIHITIIRNYTQYLHVRRKDDEDDVEVTVSKADNKSRSSSDE